MSSSFPPAVQLSPDQVAERAERYRAERAARAARFDELSAKHRTESETRFQTAHSIQECIPFGQPILVGHHSERGHRAAIARIDTNMRKSIEHSKKADYYENKADNARNNTAIFSDDPEAVAKMREKIAGLRESNDRAKTINARLRKMKTRQQAMEEVARLPDTDADKKLLAVALAACNWYANPPERINAYYMDTTHNNAEIKRLEARIRERERVQSMETSEKTIGNVRVVQNVEENRLQLFFPAKPDEATRDKLKRWGFRWSPLAGAWQRHLNNAAQYAAKMVLQP